MEKEPIQSFERKVATVVGGNGSLGQEIKKRMEPLFDDVIVCGEDDPFRDFAQKSDNIFFAVDDTQIISMLQASRDILTPNHTILDGASVKAPLITTYRELDSRQISVCSTHLGATPEQPWRGIKVWMCEVGENSERAKKLAFDIFIQSNVHMRSVKIEDHKNVEIDQFLTMFAAYAFAGALRHIDLPLGVFDEYATLNSELNVLPVARTLGQRTKIPSEIIVRQPLQQELIDALKQGVLLMEQAIGTGSDEEKMVSLQNHMQELVDFHNKDGAVTHLFEKAGVIGARNANLRMYSLSFRLTNDSPGSLHRILPAFYEEGANLTAIDSMPGVATVEELESGVDPDEVVDFHVGIDPKTINKEKEDRIREKLRFLGCKL